MKRFYKKSVCACVIIGLIIGTISPFTGMAMNQADEKYASIENVALLHLEQIGDVSSNGKINLQWQTEEGTPFVLENNEAPMFRAYKRAASGSAVDLPEAFDLRKQGLVTETKNQGNTGICWVFAGLGSIESNILVQELGQMDDLDLSELHTSWFAYHAPTDVTDPLYGDGDTLPGTDFLNYGGYSGLLASTLARGSGTQDESVAPFILGTGTSTLNQQQMTSFMQDKEVLRYASDYQLLSSDRLDIQGELLDETARDEVKTMLQENGAIDVSYYTPASSSSKYYNTFTDEESGGQGVAYYQDKMVNTDEDDYSNHSVLLVGWDDNFSKENFYEECQPSSDGAWLIRNSWGENWGSDGYFWISYEEPSLCEFVSLQVKATEENNRIYQYDGYDIWAAIGGYEDFKAANVFTASKNGTLKEVSFYTLVENVPYEIDIYKNITGSTPEAGTLVEGAKITGTASYSGYHTVNLPEEVRLERGEKFSVVMTYKEGSSGVVYLPVEGDYPQITDVSSSAYSSRPGQSYLYDDSEWLDMSEAVWIGDELTTLNNVPIKALTVDDENQPELPVEPTPTPGGGTLGGGSGAGGDEQTGDDSSQNGDNNTQDGNNTQTGGKDTQTGEKDRTGIEVTNITPSKNKVTLGKGEKYQMQVTVKPAAYTGTLQYSSTKKAVATVSNSGVVTAKKVGSAVIRVSASNGKSAQMTVTVKKAPKKILIKKAKKSLKVKKTDKIKVKLLPKKSASYKLTYKSSKRQVATVSATGVVKAKKKGRTVITVSTYNKKKVKYILRVK